MFGFGTVGYFRFLPLRLSPREGGDGGGAWDVDDVSAKKTPPCPLPPTTATIRWNIALVSFRFRPVPLFEFRTTMGLAIEVSANALFVCLGASLLVVILASLLAPTAQQLDKYPAWIRTLYTVVRFTAGKPVLDRSTDAVPTQPQQHPQAQQQQPKYPPSVPGPATKDVEMRQLMVDVADSRYKGKTADEDADQIKDREAVASKQLVVKSYEGNRDRNIRVMDDFNTAVAFSKSNAATPLCVAYLSDTCPFSRCTAWLLDQYGARTAADVPVLILREVRTRPSPQFEMWKDGTVYGRHMGVMFTRDVNAWAKQLKLV